jgi:hypothetical protein
MATFAAKLMNPTSWEAKLDYDRGVRLRIKPFDSVNLTMQQMDDFRGDKPGSEAVEEVLNTYGLFLFDADRPYDNQALEALERMVAVLQDRYRGVEKRQRDGRSAQGISTDESAIKETMELLGYGTIGRKIETLKEQITIYRKAVVSEGRAVREKLDPKRTIFCLNPPREFPSVAAMNFFLEQNEDIRTEHLALIARGKAATAVNEAAPGPEATASGEAFEGV